VNLPNRITVLRILLVPLILLFMLPMPQLGIFTGWNQFISKSGNLIAFALFALASLTDLIDGHVARKLKLVSNLGKFLDPIADKLLVVSVLIALAQQGRLNALPLIIIIFREFMVTGIRLAASDKGVVIAASNLAKVKTVSQIIAILIILGERFWWSWLGDAAMMIAVVLTLISGIDYLWKNRSFLNE
jgi:CDP-diacylglycerol--glycerol-3-phosphate 3-phosphatidyltransferase